MSKNANYIGQPIFSQVLKLLPKQNITQISNKFNGDRYVKRFSCYDHVVSLLYSSFHNCSSLREVVTGMMACYGKLQHLGLSDYPKRSTLSDANKRRPVEIFEAIYFDLFNRYSTFLSDSPKQGLIDNRLFIVDSTTISLFQDILRNAGNIPKSGKRKGGLKAHVLINTTQDVPSLVRMTKASASDVNFLKEIHLPPKSVLVFDRGYKSYAQYERFTKEDITWITRQNTTAIVDIIEEYELSENDRLLGVISDKRVILGNTQNKKQLRIYAREIEYRDEISNKTFCFISNNQKMSPTTIAQLYQRRWQIETLFKRLKQNNQLNYFMGENENAIKIQVWCSLITDLITKIIQKKAKRKWSFANLSSMLRIHLMTYTSLYDFLENPEKNLKRTLKNDAQLKLFSSV